MIVLDSRCRCCSPLSEISFFQQRWFLCPFHSFLSIRSMSKHKGWMVLVPPPLNTSLELGRFQWPYFFFLSGTAAVRMLNRPLFSHFRNSPSLLALWLFTNMHECNALMWNNAPEGRECNCCRSRLLAWQHLLHEQKGTDSIHGTKRNEIAAKPDSLQFWE